MRKAKHLSWENFCASLLVPGEQRVHRVHTSPVIELFWDGTKNTVGIWIEEPKHSLLPEAVQRLASVSVTNLARQGRAYLELACNSRPIFRQFYLFTIAVADRVMLEGLTPIAAVEVELQCFSDLLQEKHLLGIERQIGLLGEMLILERILNREGPGAIDAWVGPTAEPHDFRIGTHEFEVKTSLGSRRVHIINGLSQLLPSPNCSLVVLSILLGPAGSQNGFSLADKANNILARLAGTSSEQQFIRGLETNGYSIADTTQYTRTFDFRRPLAVVKVNEGLPAITMSHLRAMLGSEYARIEHLGYELNFEGLQAEEPTDEFVNAFPFPAKA